MKGIALSAKEYPGILLDVRYDDKGDLDRASFIVRVSGGRHEFIATLPPSSGSVAGAPAAGK
jgi:branched-chain amino acid transport system substrate-binding protein